ncbi:enoyl-CoA hydratase [Paralimibaculum aggregatum]|uniref:Enoyl-CoA hydratase n=1 Tax=Paralimibaculum aggregatum TaxID=3036245 RepID=A0ABQ6LS78_9RHOB|nr:enoyl-CoA hydratase-related protein [Limibaculum sp. NKW23]GMG84944.1 enoyl-CoA hydratase [Limibaculum sp. NKW23]
MPQSTPDNPVRIEDAGVVRIVRIDRPAVLNALSPAVLTELAAAIREGDANPAVRAFVLTGGTEVFSAGADLDALAGITAPAYPTSPNADAFAAVRAARKPVVAAVAGWCLGGGCELALGTDLIVAGDTAVFGQPEIAVGIIPGAGGTLLWAPRTGPGAQAEAALTGRRIDAWEARRLGLADRVVPSAHVVTAATALAEEIAAKAPLAAAAAKRAMRGAWRAPLEMALSAEVEILSGLLASEDAAEGTAAFLEKRAPRFEGR